MATAKMLNKFRPFRALPGTILPKFNNASLLLACERINNTSLLLSWQGAESRACAVALQFCISTS